MALTTKTLYRQTSGITGIVNYLTADAIATVVAANYFNAGIKDLNLHDVINVVHGTGGTVGLRTLVVSGINRSTGVVTVTAAA